jgi:hypothetical protein
VPDFKLGNRSALLSDSVFFASELIRRLEALSDCEPTPPVRVTWQRSSRGIRAVRHELRKAQDRDRDRRRLEDRLQESRR